MTANRTCYPPTTPQQRKKLFESWEQSKNITAACRKADVGRGTFYKWKPRFLKGGAGGLESYAKLGTPVGTGRVVAEISTNILLSRSGERVILGERSTAGRIITQLAQTDRQFFQNDNLRFWSVCNAHPTIYQKKPERHT